MSALYWRMENIFILTTRTHTHYGCARVCVCVNEMVSDFVQNGNEISFTACKPHCLKMSARLRRAQNVYHHEWMRIKCCCSYRPLVIIINIMNWTIVTAPIFFASVPAPFYTHHDVDLGFCWALGLQHEHFLVNHLWIMQFNYIYII